MVKYALGQIKNRTVKVKFCVYYLLLTICKLFALVKFLFISAKLKMYLDTFSMGEGEQALLFFSFPMFSFDTLKTLQIQSRPDIFRSIKRKHLEEKG